MPEGAVGIPSNVPIPDPTALTSDLVQRELKAERDYVNGQLAILLEKLAGIDKATIIFNDTLTKVPTDVDKQVGNLEKLMNVQLTYIADQLVEVDKRSVRDSAANALQVNTAFLAVEKLTLSQQAASKEALTKSEVNTTALLKGLTDKIDDLKDRLPRSEGTAAGKAAAYAAVATGIFLLIGIVTLIITLVGKG